MTLASLSSDVLAPIRTVMPAVRGAGGQGAVMTTHLYATSVSVTLVSDKPGKFSAALTVWLNEHQFDLSDNDTLNSTRANKMTPLMHAARLGDLEIARELLTLGVDVNRRNIDGNNALWLACFGGNVELIDALIVAGIDINNINDTGATTLMYAASAGKTAAVQRLLAAGVDTSSITVDGFTACDMAANIECLQLLRHAHKHLLPGAAA
jgi:ankyrin repeat protein